MKYFCLVFITLCACNKALPNDPRTISGINSEMLPYVQYFESLLGRGIGDIPIQFVRLQGSAVGECVSWSSEYKEIRIDPDYWITLENSTRESLIFHELGHCVLNRDHDTEMMDYHSLLVPDSYMYPYMFYSDDLSALHNHYLAELFSQSNTIVNDRFVRTDHAEVLK